MVDYTKQILVHEKLISKYRILFWGSVSSLLAIITFACVGIWIKPLVGLLCIPSAIAYYLLSWNIPDTITGLMRVKSRLAIYEFEQRKHPDQRKNSEEIQLYLDQFPLPLRDTAKRREP